MIQKTSDYFALLASFLLFVLAVSPACAVDGVIEINQARALAGNVTPDDTPGFPITISKSGSYRLTGSLVTSADTTAIIASAKDVTIDLNGFAITGPTTCNGFSECITENYSYGIFSGESGTSVMNGTIRGMGFGIYLGPSGRVERVRAESNYVDGITAGNNALISNCMANSNGLMGIKITSGLLQGNTVSYNGGHGIGTFGATINNNYVIYNGASGIVSTYGVAQGNVSSNNGELGINAAGLGCANNSFSNNNGGVANTQYECIKLGNNICGTALCP